MSPQADNIYQFKYTINPISSITYFWLS